MEVVKLTGLLKKAIDEVETLSESEQDSFAQLILEEIHSENKWDDLFEKTSTKLEEFAKDIRIQVSV